MTSKNTYAAPKKDRIAEERDIHIKDGALDMAVTVAQRAPRGLADKTLARQGWLILRRADITAPRNLKQYLKHAHVAVGFAGREPGYTDIRLETMGAARNVIAWTPRFASIPDLVLQSGAIATMPAPIARTFAEKGGLAVSKPPFELDPTPVKLCWHERLRYDPVNQWARLIVENTVTDIFEKKG